MTVNQRVLGSSPRGGADSKKPHKCVAFFYASIYLIPIKVKREFLRFAAQVCYAVDSDFNSKIRISKGKLKGETYFIVGNIGIKYT